MSDDYRVIYPLTIEELKQVLVEHSVPYKAWGDGGSKSVEDLFTDLSDGREVLEERNRGLRRCLPRAFVYLQCAALPERVEFPIAVRLAPLQSTRTSVDVAFGERYGVYLFRRSLQPWEPRRKPPIPGTPIGEYPGLPLAIRFEYYRLEVSEAELDLITGKVIPGVRPQRQERRSLQTV